LVDPGDRIGDTTGTGIDNAGEVAGTGRDAGGMSGGYTHPGGGYTSVNLPGSASARLSASVNVSPK
jgi:hypothetical protein